MRRYVALSVVVLVAFAAAGYMLYLHLGLGCVRGFGDPVNETRDAMLFDGLSADGTLTVILRDGDARSVRVEAQQGVSGSVVTRVDGGRLVVGLQDTCVVGPIRPVVVWVTAPTFASVSAGSLARVASESPLDADTMTLSASKGGRIDATVRAKQLNTLASDSGVVSIGGTAGTHKAFATSSGSILSYGVVANVTEATAEDSGQVQVYDSGSLVAKANSNGAIYYMGAGSLTKQASTDGFVERTG